MNTIAAKQNAPALAQYHRFLRLAGVAALFALALTPLLFDPMARDDAYFTPKWAWIASWSALGAASVCARALAGRVTTFPFNEIWIGSFLFALWHWVAVLWARSPSLGVDRAARVSWLVLALWTGLQLSLRRRALLVMGWALVTLGVATAVWTLAQDVLRQISFGGQADVVPAVPILLSMQVAGCFMLAWCGLLVNWRRGRAGLFYIAGALLAAILLIFVLPIGLLPDMLIRANLSDWRGFLVAGLGNTSHIGDLTALALLPALALLGEARARRARWALFIAALVLPAGLIVSFSVGSNFGLIAGAALMLGLVLWRDRGRWFARRWPRWAALLAGWAVILLFFILPHSANPHPSGIFNEAFGSGRWQAGGPTRLAIWAQTLEMIRRHPVGGVGTGNFTYVFPEMDSRLIWDRPDLRYYQGLYTNAAHNEILQQWAELGIMGLFLFLALNGLAFYSLLRDIRWCDRASFLARTTLAGLLLAWLVQAQMNFSFQHPAGALTFFGFLFAIALEKRTRPAMAAFPSLAQQFGPLLVRLDVQSMTKPTAIGMAFRLPAPLAVTLGIVLLAGLAVWIPGFWKPVRAQREYMRGCVIEDMIPAEAEVHFKHALEVDPNAQDVRSHYSDWLIRTGRPAEGLRQLVIVRRRLNSNELWEREARGLAALGRQEEARQAMETYFKRVWQARQQALRPAG